MAILSAMETVNPKVPSPSRRRRSARWRTRPDHRGLLDGPLALDNAISPEAAAIKHIVSPVAGRANVLIVPDLEAGNMLAKSLSFLAGADAAGIVLGARVPIILTSRANSRADPARLVRRRRPGGRGAARERRRGDRLRRRDGCRTEAPPVLRRQQGTGRRHRQRPVDRLWLRQGLPGGRRRARRHLAERQGAAARRAAGARARGRDRAAARRARPGQLEAVFEEIAQRWGRLDIVVHSIAFAPRADLQGGLLDCSAEGFAKAMDVSCHSFIRMARLAGR